MNEIDPTKNVIDLVTAMSQRQDDLRQLEHDLIHSLIKKNHELMELQIDRLRHERVITTAAQSEAINKAETATEKRFESVNEFRAQLSEQAATFLPREVAEAQLAEVRKQLSIVVDRLNYGQGEKFASGQIRQHTVDNMNLILATVAIIITIVVANHGI